MAKRKYTKKATLKKGFKLYPLKVQLKIGDKVFQPGDMVALSEKGYLFHKSKNRV